MGYILFIYLVYISKKIFYIFSVYIKKNFKQKKYFQTKGEKLMFNNFNFQFSFSFYKEKNIKKFQNIKNYIIENGGFIFKLNFLLKNKINLKR
jgi:hypothetical protein